MKNSLLKTNIKNLNKNKFCFKIKLTKIFFTKIYNKMIYKKDFNKNL
jgi:hypothetical protein